MKSECRGERVEVERVGLPRGFGGWAVREGVGPEESRSGEYGGRFVRGEVSAALGRREGGTRGEGVRRGWHARGLLLRMQDVRGQDYKYIN